MESGCLRRALTIVEEPSTLLTNSNQVGEMLGRPEIFLFRRVYDPPYSILTSTFHPLRSQQRFTNASDTVLGIGVETTTVAEEAIGQGRCVEFYVLEEDKRVVLERKIADAFRTAHSRGMFQVLAVVWRCMQRSHFRLMYTSAPSVCPS